MQFLHPSFLHLAWLALIPLALYLFRRRAKRVPVSTLLFFRSLAREHQESAWLRQLKRILSLLLTLAVIAFGVLALARPAADAGADTPGSMVILLDRSASMAATDAQGQTRLKAAQDLIRQRVRSLPDTVVVSNPFVNVVFVGMIHDDHAVRSRLSRLVYNSLNDGF